MNRLINLVNVEVNYFEDVRVRDMATEAMADRIVGIGTNLEEGQFLMLRIFLDNGKMDLSISSNNSSMTLDDYKWIVGDIGFVKSSEFKKIPELKATYISSDSASKRKKKAPMHEYLFVEEMVFDKERMNVGWRHIRECLNTLELLGAEIYLIVRGDKHGHETLCVRLKDEMPVRISSQLKRCFPGINLVECRNFVADFLNGREKSKYEACTISSEYASTFGAILLYGLTAKNRNFHVDARILDIRAKNIEDLEISLSVMNSLKRQRIIKLHQLLDMTEADISNLCYMTSEGRKELSRLLSFYRKEIAQISGVPLEEDDKVEESLNAEDDICDEILIDEDYIESNEDIDEHQSKEIATNKESDSSIDYYDQLNNLIGLKPVKDQVRKIVAYARMVEAMNLDSDSRPPIALNMEFRGNPGTAKTTVARILAGLLNQVGILESDQIVEVGRAGLVGRYVGETAIKVKKVFEDAKGKLLFIDEAYSLNERTEGGYGDEAINTIVQEMENNRGETIVVFAGYPDKMEQFISLNPGLRSRVPFVISFEDYSAEELASIVCIEANSRGFSLTGDAMAKVTSICEKASLDSEAGNGRFSRNLVESAMLSFALRNFGGVTSELKTKSEIKSDSESDSVVKLSSFNFELTPEDFEEPSSLIKPSEVRPIGFDRVS